MADDARYTLIRELSPLLPSKWIMSIIPKPLKRPGVCYLIENRNYYHLLKHYFYLIFYFDHGSVVFTDNIGQFEIVVDMSDPTWLEAVQAMVLSVDDLSFTQQTSFSEPNVQSYYYKTTKRFVESFLTNKGVK